MIPEIHVLVISVVVALIAGFVRGYSGFGSAMVIVTCLSLLFPISSLVPAMLLLDVIASICLLPGIWKQVNWKSLGWLLAGVLIGTPIGVYLLATIPDKPMRMAIAIVVMVLSLFLLRGFKLKRMPGKPLSITTGTIAGIISGATAISGPPVVLFYFSSPAGVNISRASIIAFFLGTDAFASAVCATHGLINYPTLTVFAILVAPMLLGLWFGNRTFLQGNPEVLRKRILMILLIISTTILIKTIIQIL